MINNFPIPDIESKTINKMVNLVDQILIIKNTNPDAKTDKLEKQIDDLVYKLYDLTEEEIKIIEGNE